MIDLSSAASIERAFFRAFEPPPNVKWYDWARNGGIILPAKVATPRKGSYDVWFTPALVRAAAALADPNVWCVVIKKGSQGGGTQMGFAWLASMAVLDPEQSAIVLGTEDLAKQRSKNTAIPMIEASPLVFEQVAKKKNALGITEYEFNGCRIFWIGGNSVSRLASNPVVRMHISEENKFEEDKKEGSSVELAIERMKNFPQRKALRECTPSTPGVGISKAYDDGTQEEMHVPCPHCEFRAPMVFFADEGGHFVEFDSTLSIGEAAKSAHYTCAACRKPWTDAQRLDSLDRAARMENHGYIGKRTVDETGGIVSIHYPTALSPMVKTADIVAKFLRVKDTPSELKTFVTGWRGLEWRPDTKAVSDDGLIACRAGYERGPQSCPFDAEPIKGFAEKDSLITIFADVQKAGFWVAVRRWWRGGASALLSFEYVETFAQVANIEAHWMGVLKGEHAKRMEEKKTKLQKRLMVWMDSGDGQRQPEIIEACLRYGWTATKGASADMDTLFRESHIEQETGWKVGGQKTSVVQVLINTTSAKHDLTNRIERMEKAQAGTIDGPLVPWWIPGNMPIGKKEYTGQVVAEEYNEEKGIWVLRDGYKHNHAFDCEVGCYVCAHACGFNSLVPD